VALEKIFLKLINNFKTLLRYERFYFLQIYFMRMFTILADAMQSHFTPPPSPYLWTPIALDVECKRGCFHTNLKDFHWNL
jgi:hypothetical protein